MKKQTLKNLALQKKTISNLDQIHQVKGGAAGSTSCPLDFLTSIVFDCPGPKPKPQEPLPASSPEICTGPYGECPINI
ncbi:hypothetical protein KORDIASMS9_01314 [Kordia sp. SMS9]|uniref:hypothetical protein n=1 Tax=Kordia sp. SMS9 TaxID=2282170 RepID=UPI000E0D0292|nr:hypothetical protein [Kordia sp. SMS9]AXG69095.1 hypothetical protein KORDIASMS9_01314 [Kordia sp. SMS9]